MANKIAIIASSINTNRQNHLLECYKDILALNKNVQLFIGSKSKEIPYALNFKISSKKDQLKYFLQGKIPSKIQPLIDFKPKIIHLLTSSAFQNIQSIISENTKLIVSFRGYDLNVYPNLSEENLKMTLQIFEKADVLHFISEDLRKKAIKLGANSRKCVVIYRSVHVCLPINKSKSNETLIITSVGRLVWEKGYIYALETMFILKQRGYKFKYYIVGSGADKNAILFHIDRLNLRDFVTLKGELTRDEVKNLLIKSDIYFQPSVSEALSNALIEASNLNLPVVSSDIGGIPEVIENNLSGFLTPICDPVNYANALIKLMENEALRLEMGKKGHQIIIEKFNRENEISKWLNLYENYEKFITQI